MSKKVISDKIKVYRFWEINSHLSNQEKTTLYNKENNTNYSKRTLQQIHSNVKAGIEHANNLKGVDLETLAQKEFNIMKQQKKNTLLKKEAHKVARDIASREMIIDAIKNNIDTKIKKRRIYKKHANKNRTIVDLVIADLQYKGNEEEWVHNIFEKFIPVIERYRKLENKVEFRFVFLGDDVEAAHAHVSQIAINNTDTITQTIQLSKLYIHGINELLNYIPDESMVSLVFVPYSNHGLIGGKGKERYQFPKEDLGRIIFEYLRHHLPEKMHIYEPDNDRFLIETKDTIYLHGHQGFVKNKQRFLETVGIDKDVFMGHLHHLVVEEQKKRDIIVFPTCRKDLQDYERLAGFNPTRQVAVVIREKNNKIIERIKL